MTDPAADAPTPDDTDGTVAPDAAPDDDTGEDEGSTVLVTICKASDGTYTVYSGDEPEDDGAEGDDEGSADEGDETVAAGGGDEGEGGEGEPEGQAADSIGAALKLTMDILKQDAETENGESGSDAFQAGFDGGASASPAKPMMATGTQQKY